MDKATKALRRSSVRLKSMGTGHCDLKMVISELKDVRSSAKAFMVAQNTALLDLLKWATKDENRAIQETFTQLAELNALWTEVQKDFTEHLRDFTRQFEMILEGEEHVDQARSHMEACEHREAKIRKELKKSAKKCSFEEVYQIKEKLFLAECSRDAARMEVAERTKENEAVKLIRVKEGLLKLSDSYLEMAHKCHVIYEAHKDVAFEIPDVHDSNIHDIRYTGGGIAKQAVLRAREQVLQYQRPRHHSVACAPLPDEPPPPYSPIHSREDGDFTQPAACAANTTADPSNPFARQGSTNLNQSNSSVTSFSLYPNLSPHGNPFEEEPSNRYSNHQSGPQNDVRWDPEYEEELAGAVSRFST